MVISLSRFRTHRTSLKAMSGGDKQFSLKTAPCRGFSPQAARSAGVIPKCLPDIFAYVLVFSVWPMDQLARDPCAQVVCGLELEFFLCGVSALTSKRSNEFN